MSGKIDKIKEDFLIKGVEAILVASDASIKYLTGYENFSSIEREAFLLLTKNRSFLLTDGRYTEAIKKQVPHFEIIEISSSLSYIQALQSLVDKNSIKVLGIEEDVITVSEFKWIKKIVQKTINYTVSNFRSTKNRQEIKEIQAACKFGDETFNYILKHIKYRVSEKQLAYKMENFMRQNLIKPSFDTIVAFGANAAIPHHHTSDKILTRENNLLLFDFGCQVNQYCSDMTRVVFLGKASKKQRAVYNIVLDSQKVAINFLSDKVSKGVPVYGNEVDKVARDYIIEQGYPAYSHGLGHGIGLEVHESPRLSLKSKDLLKNGMVFSIEPGVYLPGEFGVRIEDLFAIENNKLIQLTHAPKEIIEF